MRSPTEAAGALDSKLNELRRALSAIRRQTFAELGLQAFVVLTTVILLVLVGLYVAGRLHLPPLLGVIAGAGAGMLFGARVLDWRMPLRCEAATRPATLRSFVVCWTAMADRRATS